jgi:glycosyltransferase involved in cell wall biosynthesis
MLRIALYHNLPSGGAKRTLYDQAKRLCKNQQIDVFTLSCSNHDFADIRPFCDNYFVYPYTPLSLLKKPFRRLNQIIRLLDIKRLDRVSTHIADNINTRDYDVIFVQPCQFVNSPPLLRYLEKPSVFYCHETLRIVYDSPVHQRSFRRNCVQRLLDKLDPLPRYYLKFLANEDFRNLRAADCVLVNSEYSQTQVSQAYKIKTRVCYHGVDTSLFQPVNLKREQFVLSVGALRPNKGFDFIIKSLALIPIERRPSFIIVTNFPEPNERSYLTRLAQELGVHLEIRTLISDAELRLLYCKALMTLYAPIQEPFGLVPLESMACGTPVIGVSDAGLRETINDGDNGVLTDRNPHLFSQAILSLLENLDLIDRMGRQGRNDVIDNWSWETALLRLERHLAEIACIDIIKA